MLTPPWSNQKKRAKPGASRFRSRSVTRSARSSELPVRSDRARSSTSTLHTLLMAYRFLKHYTRAEARGLLPQIRRWLKRAQDLRAELERRDERLGARSEERRVGKECISRWS